MTTSAITGASILTPAGIVTDRALLVRDGRIAGIGDVAEDVSIETLDGGWLVPGFIDIQVNGGGGVLFNDDITAEGIAAIAAAHRRFGTTALLPTLISDTLDKVAAAIDAVDAAIEAGVPGVVGIHIEGPFLNPGKHGIHDVERIRPLGEAALTLLTRPGRGRRVVTIAPELAPPGAIERLTAAGLIVCAGHSLATYDETVSALDRGLAGFTHLFNAMTGLGSREPGMVGAALDDRRGRFGLIADGHHVHPAAMRVAVHARGVDGVMLVTDAMPPVGTEKTGFTLGGLEIGVADGALRGPDGTLAGSVLDMAASVRNAMSMIGVSLSDASRMASENPAAFLGLDGQIGTIVQGARADLVHLTPDFQVVKVWIGGEAM